MIPGDMKFSRITWSLRNDKSARPSTSLHDFVLGTGWETTLNAEVLNAGAETYWIWSGGVGMEGLSSFYTAADAGTWNPLSDVARAPVLGLRAGAKLEVRGQEPVPILSSAQYSERKKWQRNWAPLEF